jgi:cytochrome P450
LRRSNPPSLETDPSAGKSGFLFGLVVHDAERTQKQMLYRTARSDYQVGPVTIPDGARVLLSLGAANRDPQVFDDPDEFRVDRNPTEHLAFGFGAHLCLGAQLTRMEAQAVLRELVTRVRSIEAIGETQWSTGYLLRGPERINVRLTPSIVAG